MIGKGNDSRIQEIAQGNINAKSKIYRQPMNVHSWLSKVSIVGLRIQTLMFDSSLWFPSPAAFVQSIGLLLRKIRTKIAFTSRVIVSMKWDHASQALGLTCSELLGGGGEVEKQPGKWGRCARQMGLGFICEANDWFWDVWSGLSYYGCPVGALEKMISDHWAILEYVFLRSDVLIKVWYKEI